MEVNCQRLQNRSGHILAAPDSLASIAVPENSSIDAAPFPLATGSARASRQTNLADASGWRSVFHSPASWYHACQTA